MFGSVEFTPIVAPLLVSMAISVLFGYLYYSYHTRFLGIWSLAWVLWTVRQGHTLFYPDMSASSYGEFAVLLIFAYTTLFLAGAAELSGKRVLQPWLVTIVLSVCTLPVTTAMGLIELSAVLIIFALGSGWILAGLLFIKAESEFGIERWIPGLALVAVGANYWKSYFSISDLAYSAWGTSITLILQLSIAFGVLVVLSQMHRKQIVQKQEALETALRMALADTIPSCASCGSVRSEQNNYISLENYIKQQTDARFSHGICPSCQQQLYPQLNGNPPTQSAAVQSA